GFARESHQDGGLGQGPATRESEAKLYRRNAVGGPPALLHSDRSYADSECNARGDLSTTACAPAWNALGTAPARSGSKFYRKVRSTSSITSRVQSMSASV